MARPVAALSYPATAVAPGAECNVRNMIGPHLWPLANVLLN